jgi:hypothetical protein
MASIRVTGAREIEAALKDLGSRAAGRVVRSALTRAVSAGAKQGEKNVCGERASLRQDALGRHSLHQGSSPLKRRNRAIFRGRLST